MYLIDETDTRFCIKQSSLPNAGLGCFAVELIKKNEYLEVIGILVKTGSIADKCTEYAKHYKFSAGLKNDARIVPLGYGGMVNHTDDKTKQNCILTYLDRNRTKRSEHSTQTAYVASRDIQAGEELLGYYGDIMNKNIQEFNRNMQFLTDDKTEWQKFLDFNLYDLKSIIGSLTDCI